MITVGAARRKVKFPTIVLLHEDQQPALVLLYTSLLNNISSTNMQQKNISQSSSRYKSNKLPINSIRYNVLNTNSNRCSEWSIISSIFIVVVVNQLHPLQLRSITSICSISHLLLQLLKYLLCSVGNQ